MKKTLLLTTALIGTLSILGTAQAEMKIGGGVKTAWKSAESVTATGPATSGFSQERQIDFSSSGTLNNGMKYAAGFSMEQDGGQAGFDGGEGNYVNVTSGSTTVELGNDHAPLNGDFNIVPRAGNAMNEEIGSLSGLQYNQGTGTIKESMGIAVLQKFTGGAVSLNYVPKVGSKAETADTTVNATTGANGYEVSYFGQPVSGLDVFLNYATADKDAAAKDAKTQSAGVAYSVGSLKFGIEKANNDLNTGAETNTLEYGVVFKMSDNATVGIGHTTTEGKTVAGADEAAKEKINYLQVGYNLGAIGTQLSYIDADNLGYVATQDSKVLVLKVNTKF
jgi:hypothetical protein